VVTPEREWDERGESIVEGSQALLT
jgi:hypothetical protein